MGGKVKLYGLKKKKKKKKKEGGGGGNAHKQNADVNLTPPKIYSSCA